MGEGLGLYSPLHTPNTTLSHSSALGTESWVWCYLIVIGVVFNTSYAGLNMIRVIHYPWCYASL